MIKRSLRGRLASRARRILLARGLLPARKDADRLRWGIVGTGYMASVWADLLLVSPGAQLHAVCSRAQPRADWFGRRFGCARTFGRLEDMLDQIGTELDAVYIATPLDSHHSIIKKCIEAGVNVLTEKPATRTVEDWSALSKAAKERGVLLVEGMWMRCLPTFETAEKWIDEGKIGDVKWIKADFNKFQQSLAERSPDETGVLMDYGVYALSFVCHFLGGRPEWCRSETRSDCHGRDADWAIMAGRGDRTAAVNLSCNLHASSTAAVIGDKGMIEWGDPFNRTGEITFHSFASDRSELRKFDYRNDGFEYQLEEVTRALKSRLSESSILTHDATLDVLDFAEQLQAQKG